MQEEACCLCTSVEGIEAEVEANNFGVQMLLQLLKLSYKMLARCGHRVHATMSHVRGAPCGARTEQARRAHGSW